MRQFARGQSNAAARHATFPAAPPRSPAPSPSAEGAVGRDFSRLPVASPAPLRIQPKLSVGDADDPSEQAADHAADRVMRMRDPRPAPIDIETGASGGKRTDAPAAVHEALRAQGQPLDGRTRAFMEPRFGRDFSGVRVHADRRAADAASAIGAEAFTSGRSVVFAAGRYAPDAEAGQRLLAHELAHVVQQSGSSDGPIRRKIEMKGKPAADGSEHWDTLSKQGQTDFLKKHYKTQDERNKAKAILDDMADAGDSFYFSSEDELVSELSKRMKTAQYLQQSQLSQAFGYPDVQYWTDPRKLGPRVNKEARDYWGPVEYTPFYSFRLSPLGRNQPYQALIRLFKSQGKKPDRTLFHCDYLASVVHMRAFAETIGVAEFERRVKAGIIPLVLKWNGFDDISVGSAQQRSLQIVRPSSERDLVIGDHVVFWNHRAYDLLNQNIGEAWRLENAVLDKKLNGVDIFEGHGSGQQTNETMRAALLKRYNEVTGKAQAIINRTKSPDPMTRATATWEMAVRFPNVRQYGADWYIAGVAHGKIYATKVQRVDSTRDPDLVGLRDPEDPTKMNYVKRPVESAK